VQEQLKTPHLLVDVLDAAAHENNSGYNATEWQRDALYVTGQLVSQKQHQHNNNNNNGNDTMMMMKMTTRRLFWPLLVR
jgi:hypothetical protein